MKILVACEYSGIVRDAFENAGWDAWSCDLLPTESEQTRVANKHYEGNVLEILDFHVRDIERNMPEYWDLLIGHPPCTYLSFAYTGKERYSNERLQQKINAYQFFLDLWRAPIEHICLENPFGYIHSGLLPYTQKVEPYYWGEEFGEDYCKRTCLWLKNLPPLTHSKTDTLFEKGQEVECNRIFVDTQPKNKLKNRKKVIKNWASSKERSKFHKGIAKAMAEQWTEYIKNK